MANLAMRRLWPLLPSFFPSSFPPSKDAHPSQEHTCMPIHVACSAHVSQGVALAGGPPRGIRCARGEPSFTQPRPRRSATPPGDNNTTRVLAPMPCLIPFTHRRPQKGRKESAKEGRLMRKDCWRRPFRPSSSAAAAAMRTSDWTVTGHEGSTFAYGKLRTVDVGKQTVCRNQVLTLSRLTN